MPVREAPKPKSAPKEADTGEFPSYVRKGKGGYRPPKPKTRRVTRHRRLDSRFLGAIAAVGAIVLTVVLLLLAGVRYQTFRMTDGELRFFGRVKDGEPYSGWISTADGMRGKLKKDASILYKDGGVYEGDILNGMRSGSGVYTYTYDNGTVTYIYEFTEL